MKLSKDSMDKYKITNMQALASMTINETAAGIADVVPVASIKNTARFNLSLSQKMSP